MLIDWCCKKNSRRTSQQLAQVATRVEGVRGLAAGGGGLGLGGNGRIGWELCFGRGNGGERREAGAGAGAWLELLLLLVLLRRLTDCDWAS